MIMVKIDMAMIDNKILYTSEKTGKTYLDIILKEYREGEGKFGQSHYVNQSASREHNAMLREKNEKMPIIGNATTYPNKGSSTGKPQATSQPDKFSYDPSMKF